LTEGKGAIALAAYKPDDVLFGRQLRSIQAQTLEDWTCVISADGGWEEVQDAVRRAVGDDDRFVVPGHDNRVGFYLNFERALRAVHHSAAWIALSDQDDVWYPQKLARLVPLLATDMMVSAQARVVEEPSGRIIAESTSRAGIADPLDLVTMNRFSGAMSVFRREVLDLALPFPLMATPVEVHDHWIAVCASVLGSTDVVDEVLQDYVQHQGNVLGEVSAPGRFRVSSAWRTLQAGARRYEGSTTPRALVRAVYDMGYGWRALMVAALQERRGIDDPAVAPLVRTFGARARRIAAMRYFAAAAQGASNSVMLDAGVLLDPFQRRRALSARASVARD
jgi:hypothetical protein